VSCKARVFVSFYNGQLAGVTTSDELKSNLQAIRLTDIAIRINVNSNNNNNPLYYG